MRRIIFSLATFLITQLNVKAQESFVDTLWVVYDSAASPLHAISFSTEQNGIIVGDGGNILVTTDGGYTWTHKTYQDYYLYDVHFVNSSVGYTVGAGSGSPALAVIKTIDGGVTWNAAHATTLTFLPYSVYFTDENTGYVVGTSGGIAKTTDGGSTWNTQTSGVTEILYKIMFIDANTGYAVGTNGIILKTSNSGTSWNTLISGTTVQLDDVSFVNNNIGYVGGSGKIVLKTMDGGDTWKNISEDSDMEVFEVSSIHALTEDEVYIGGGFLGGGLGFGGVAKTLNGDTSWYFPDPNMMVSGVVDMSFPGNKRGFGVTKTGQVICSNCPTEEVSSVKNLNGSNEFTIYPNPSSGEINVAYSLKKEAEVKISLYDLNGKLLRTFINENQIPGRYNEKLGGVWTLSAGNYIMSLTTDNMKTSLPIIIK